MLTVLMKNKRLKVAIHSMEDLSKILTYRKVTSLTKMNIHFRPIKFKIGVLQSLDWW